MIRVWLHRQTTFLVLALALMPCFLSWSQPEETQEPQAAPETVPPKAQELPEEKPKEEVIENNEPKVVVNPVIKMMQEVEPGFIPKDD